MRQHQTLELEPGRRVTVRELRLCDMRLCDMRHLMTILTPEELARPVPEILQTHLPELLTLRGDSLQMPAGETLEDLALSECEAIGRVWWELHRTFFLRALGLLGTRAPMASANAAPSTAQP